MLLSARTRAAGQSAMVMASAPACSSACAPRMNAPACAPSGGSNSTATASSPRDRRRKNAPSTGTARLAARFSGAALGAAAPMRATIARMCSGVVPQQPPTCVA